LEDAEQLLSGAEPQYPVKPSPISVLITDRQRGRNPDSLLGSNVLENISFCIADKHSWSYARHKS